MVTVTNLNRHPADEWRGSIAKHGRIEWRNADWREVYAGECSLTWKFGGEYKLGAALSFTCEDPFYASVTIPGVVLSVSASSWFARKVQSLIGDREISIYVDPEVVSIYPWIDPMSTGGAWFSNWSSPPNWSVFKAARRWMGREEYETVTKDLFRYTIPIPVNGQIVHAPVNAKWTRYYASQWPFPCKYYGFWTIEFADGFELDPHDKCGDGLEAISFPESMTSVDTALHEFVSAVYRDLGLVRRREDL
jgi:hypothetical protein